MNITIKVVRNPLFNKGNKKITTISENVMLCEKLSREVNNIEETFQKVVSNLINTISSLQSEKRELIKKMASYKKKMCFLNRNGKL